MNVSFRKPFLLYADRLWLPEGVDDEILGCVYAPQLVCSGCGQFLSNGFLRGTELLGYECAGGYGATRTWVQWMEKARAYSTIQSFLREASIRTKMVGMMRGLACWLQLWPETEFAAGMFKLLQAGRELTGKQKSAVLRMLEERGGWEALVERRDHVYRCEVMEFLYLHGYEILEEGMYLPPMISEEDRAVFKSLKSAAFRFGLSGKQAGKLYKLEENYLELKNCLARQVGRILFYGRGA
jgi:hypothetical protein